MSKTNTPGLDVKKLKPIEEEAKAVASVAVDIEITSHEDLTEATEILSRINKVGDLVKERKDEILKPLNAGIKSLRAFFKPIEDQCSDAKKVVSAKMLEYHNKVEEERKKKAEQIERRVEKGTMKIDTASKKLEEMEEAPKTVNTGEGSVSFKEVRVPKIVDENKIPREYLKVDMVKLRKDALAGVDIPGVIVETEKQIANRR